MTAIVLDAILVIALPVIAWGALATRDLAQAVVLFIAFGLLAAVAWTRLDAPDLALVEAAVGAGLTGALLVSTVRWFGAAPTRARGPGRWLRRGVGLLAVAAGGGLELAVLALPKAPGLAALVRARAPATGVDHPVTAVLLGFRGYDTLLEVAVLVEAVVALGDRGERRRYPRDPSLGPALDVLARLLVPGIVLVAGYLLWAGASAPGGGFQAAAVLAGGGILVVLAGVLRPLDLSSRAVRGVLVLGPGLFLASAAIPVLAGRHLLELPATIAGDLIVAIETGLMLSLALVLMMFMPRRLPAGAGAAPPEAPA